jgi:hypothetical protein
VGRLTSHIASVEGEVERRGGMQILDRHRGPESGYVALSLSEGRSILVEDLDLDFPHDGLPMVGYDNPHFVLRTRGPLEVQQIKLAPGLAFLPSSRGRMTLYPS